MTSPPPRYSEDLAMTREDLGYDSSSLSQGAVLFWNVLFLFFPGKKILSNNKSLPCEYKVMSYKAKKRFDSILCLNPSCEGWDVSDTQALKTGGLHWSRYWDPLLHKRNPQPLLSVAGVGGAGSGEAGMVLHAPQGFSALSESTRQTQGESLLICSQQKGSWPM